VNDPPPGGSTPMNKDGMEGMYAPLSILFWNTLTHFQTSFRTRTSPESDTFNSSPGPLFLRASPKRPISLDAKKIMIKIGPPPLTADMLKNEPMTLREAHYPNVYCKSFVHCMGRVTVDKEKKMIIVDKPEKDQVGGGVAIGDGLAPLARAVDPTDLTSFARIVQRGRLVQLKVHEIHKERFAFLPRLSAKLRKLWRPQEEVFEKPNSFLGGISIGLSLEHDLLPLESETEDVLEHHPHTMCLSDDLSVWVMGRKVRDRFDAKYTDLGIVFQSIQNNQIVSVLFAVNRIVLYGDKWPLLSFAFDANDSEYQQLLTLKYMHGRMAKLDGEVFPVIQLKPPVQQVSWHPDNPGDPLRAVQFHRMVAKPAKEAVEEGMTLPDGFSAVRDMRTSGGEWGPKTRSTRGTAAQYSWERGAGTWRSTYDWARRTVSTFATFPTFLSTFIRTRNNNIFQWRKMEKTADAPLSEKQQAALEAKEFRRTRCFFGFWLMATISLSICYFFYFPLSMGLNLPWYATWRAGVILISTLTVLCIVPYRLLCRSCGLVYETARGEQEVKKERGSMGKITDYERHHHFCQP